VSTEEGSPEAVEYKVAEGSPEAVEDRVAEGTLVAVEDILEAEWEMAELVGCKPL